MSNLEFHLFTLMNYPYYPQDDDVENTWAYVSSEHFNPEIMQQRYKDYMSLFAAAEESGYDGVVVNEHHSTFNAMTPAPNVTAAFAIAATKSMTIVINGNAIPLHASPVRVAEEVAFLDVVSGGRVACGLVRGTGMEYYVHPVDPSVSNERFVEAHDLIMKCFTDEGPFVWQGDHFHVPIVNPLPRSMQKPHPEIWIPGAGSASTIDLVAKNRHRFMSLFMPNWFVKSMFDKFRQTAEDKYGYEVRHNQLMMTIPTYVAETDEIAHREARAHLSWLFQTHLRVPNHYFTPPGFSSREGFAGFQKAAAKHNLKPLTQLSYEDMINDGYIIVGSPDTVSEGLQKYVVDNGAGGIIGVGSPWGDMPKLMTHKNLQIFAEEVMPNFRDGDGKPSWAKEEDRTGLKTRVELKKQFGEPEYVPTARLVPGGDRVDIRTAHIPENYNKAIAD